MGRASSCPDSAEESPTLPQRSVKQLRSSTFVGALTGLILLLSLLGSSCGGSDAKPASARANVAQVVPVSVSAAERRDMPYYLTGLGSVTAYYTVSVKSRVDGQLMQVNFKEGQTVNAGEALAVIA